MPPFQVETTPVSDYLGIYAPYTYNGTTAMACALGELATALRYSVEYVASQVRDQGVHFRWDKDIRSAKRTPFKAWACSMSRIIWFDVQAEKLKAANSYGVRNILIPLWHNIIPDHLEHLAEFSAIVCPHTAAYQLLNDNRSREIILSGWDQGLRLHERAGGCCQAGEISIYVSLNGASVQQFGEALLPILRLLLDVRPTLKITVAHTKQWSKSLMSQARALASNSKNRVRLLRNPSYHDRLAAIREHDWMFCASIAADSWWDAGEALSQGMPVICFDVPPYNEIIKSTYNGVVIPCAFKTTPVGAIVAQPNAKVVLEALSRVVDNESMLVRLQDKSWPDCENRVKSFQRVWQKVLDW